MHPVLFVAYLASCIVHLLCIDTKKSSSLSFFKHFNFFRFIEMALEKFVSKTLELLQEEREAEIQETRYEPS